MRPRENRSAASEWKKPGLKMVVKVYIQGMDDGSGNSSHLLHAPKSSPLSFSKDPGEPTEDPNTRTAVSPGAGPMG